MPPTPQIRLAAESQPDFDALGEAAAREAAQQCDRILDAIPTTFGKLATLAGLRVKGSANYSHPELGAQFPPAVVSALLQSRHETVFAGWLNLSLEEQHKQLTEVLATLCPQGEPRLPVGLCQALVPATARQAERMLFLADFECMLSVMGVAES